MPVKRFWFYNRQVDRIAAEESLRFIDLLAAVTSKEAYGERVKALEKQMGEIYVLVPEETTLEVNSGLDPEFQVDKLKALQMKIRDQNSR